MAKPAAPDDSNGGRPERGRGTLYGRRKGKRLRPGRQALMDELLPRIAIDPAALVTPGFEPRALFARPVAEVWLEIGFGGGEHLAWQARENPHVGLIGSEPFIAGAARLLSEIEAGNIDNIRLLIDDARPLLAALPEASLGRLFLLFPDPWPKTRHHKRRFVNPETIAWAAAALADGGEWRIATDVPGYCRWTLEHLTRAEAFRWRAEGPADWRQRPADWPETRYERKAIAAGRPPIYLSFERLPR